MLVATKPLSIKEHSFKEGESIPRAVQALLPPGRVESLKTNRFVEEITDEAIVARRVEELEARLEALEERLRSHKHVGRPAKED